MSTTITIDKETLDKLISQVEEMRSNQVTSVTLDALREEIRQELAANAEKTRDFVPGEQGSQVDPKFADYAADELQLAYAITRSLHKDVGRRGNKTFEEPSEGLTRAAFQANKRFNSHELEGYGEELTESCPLSELWNAAACEAMVADLFPARPMVNGKLRQPVLSSLPEPYSARPAAECAGIACTPSSPIGTEMLEHEAAKWKLKLCMPLELTEDSFLSVIPEYTAIARRAIANAIDYTVMRGDATLAPADENINHWGTDLTLPAPNFAPYWSTWDGLLHAATIDNPANCATTAVNADGFFTVGDALTADDISQLRLLMADNALRTNWGMCSDLDRLAIIVDHATYIKMLSLDEVKTCEVACGDGTVATGVLQRIWGIPIYPSAHLPLTDGQGRIDTATPANNQYGTLLLVNLDGFRRGIARDLRVTTDVDNDCDTIDIIFSWRDAFIRHSSTGAPAGIEAVAAITGINVA